jgi:hypothetical protein
MIGRLVKAVMDVGAWGARHQNRDSEMHPARDHNHMHDFHIR